MATTSSPQIITPPPPQIIVPRPNQRTTLVQNLPPATPHDPPPSERVYKLVAQWLSSTVGIKVSPNTVGLLLGSLPGISTAFSVFDVVRDVTVLVSYDQPQKKWGYESFTHWTETAIDIVGLLPVPPSRPPPWASRASSASSTTPRSSSTPSKSPSAAWPLAN